MAFEITYRDRFSNDAADSGRLEIDCIFLGNAGGHDHAMEQMRFRRSQSLQNGEAIDIRHDEIENDGVEIGIRQRADCRRSVACARHRVRSALRVSCAGRPKRRMSAVLLPLIRDLTSRKKEEAKLEDSRRRLEALFNSAMDAILFLDSNRHCRRSVDDLIEYEFRLNDVLSRFDDVVICAYDLTKFGASTIVDVIRTILRS